MREKQRDNDHSKFAIGSKTNWQHSCNDQPYGDGYKTGRDDWNNRRKQEPKYGECVGTFPKDNQNVDDYEDETAFGFPQGSSKEMILKIEFGVLQESLKIGLNRAESGGMFGFDEAEKDKVARAYCFDETSKRTSVTFTPDVRFLNKVLNEWNKKGLRLMGFVHSHPGRMGTPSNGDLVYAKRILDYNRDMDVLWLPIINTIPDSGALTLTPWYVVPNKKWFNFSGANVQLMRGKIMIVTKEDNCEQTKRELQVGERRFQVILNHAYDKIHFPVDMDVKSYFGQPTRQTPDNLDSRLGRLNNVVSTNPTWGDNHSSNNVKTENKPMYPGTPNVKSRFDKAQTFNRVQTAYDMPAMQSSRLVVIGSGGAADFLEVASRMGIEQFVIIDPDVVSETNLATQQTYRKDIGRPKVECVKERILDVNPDAAVDARQKYLDDLSDEEMKNLLTGDLYGRQTKRTILCGFTDSFPAQSRVNRLALKYGVPSLCAQVYKEGCGAEITFTYPGVTPACHRCILSKRYAWYAEGNENDVVSNGTPYFATMRLNAAKGFVLLAMLHHKTNHPRWGKILEQIGDRNLLQIRMTPNFGEDVFGNPEYDPFSSLNDSGEDFLFFDETIWKHEKPESISNGYKYDCPECGGTGNLCDALGKFTDTRVAPKSCSK